MVRKLAFVQKKLIALVRPGFDKFLGPPMHTCIQLIVFSSVFRTQCLTYVDDKMTNICHMEV
jgi:hypothetical protein